MENNTNEKKKNNAMIIIIVLAIIALGLGGYFFLSSSSKSNVKPASTKETPTPEQSPVPAVDTSKLDFDFDELTKTLQAEVKKDNITTIVQHCTSKEAKDGELPETEESAVFLR